MHKLKGGEKTRKQQTSEGSPETCPQCGQGLPMRREPMCLRELDIVAGKLNEVADPEGEDFSLAAIENMLIEVPRSLSEQLSKLLGKRIFLAKVNGQIRAGQQTCTQ